MQRRSNALWLHATLALGSLLAIRVAIAADSGGTPPTSPQSAPTGAAAAAPNVGDEIIVTGKTRATLQAALIRAEDNLFAIYNSINGSDDFDIHCYQETRYFSHTKQRICQPNYERAANAGYAQSLLEQLRGQSGPNPQEYQTERGYKSSLMRKDWQQQLKAHPQMLGAAMEVAALQKALSADKIPTRRDRGENREEKHGTEK
jgi:hypothetical protein